MSAVKILSAPLSKLAAEINSLLGCDCTKIISNVSVRPSGKAVTLVLTDAPQLPLNSTGTVHHVDVFHGSKVQVQKKLDQSLTDNPYRRLESLLEFEKTVKVEVAVKDESGDSSQAKKAAKKSGSKNVACFVAIVSSVQP